MLASKVLFCVYLIVLRLTFVFTKAVNRNLTLELVQVLIRHGSRTPNHCEIKFLTNFNETDYEPYGIGRLTNYGMMEEYEIGKMLRKRYNNFLPKTYRDTDVFSHSSSFDRTKASVQLVLAGLYPPGSNLNWNANLKWIPIPIHANPRGLDMLFKSRHCPKFKEHLEKLYNSSQYKNSLADHTEIFEFLKNKYSFDITPNDVMCAYHVNVVQKSLNLPLIEWYTEELSDKLLAGTLFHFHTLSSTRLLSSLNGGTLVRRFVDNMNKKPIGKKIYLYSGHDKNTYAFAKAHGISLHRYPEFGSAHILETLRDDQNRRYVKYLMWSGKPKALTKTKLSDCSDIICPMSEYLKMIEPILPSDEEMRCLFDNLKPTDIERILFEEYNGTD